MGFGDIGRGTSQIIADACQNSQIHALYPILATVVELTSEGAPYRHPKEHPIVIRKAPIVILRSVSDEESRRKILRWRSE